MSNTTKTTRKTREESGSRKKAWTPVAKLATPEAPEGYKYRWVRHELMGEDQASNVYDRTRQGYEPVKPEELEGFLVDKMEGGKHDGVVRSGDLILMKVPVEIAESRNEYFENQARRMQAAVDQELDVNQNEEMPIHRTNKSSVTRGNPNSETSFED